MQIKVVPFLQKAMIAERVKFVVLKLDVYKNGRRTNCGAD